MSVLVSLIDDHGVGLLAFSGYSLAYPLGSLAAVCFIDGTTSIINVPFVGSSWDGKGRWVTGTFCLFAAHPVVCLFINLSYRNLSYRATAEFRF